jgi:hypothetical protein
MLGPAVRRDPSLRPQLPSTLRMSARAALGVAAGQYFSLFLLIGSAARRGIAEGLGAEARLAHGARLVVTELAFSFHCISVDPGRCTG